MNHKILKSVLCLCLLLPACNNQQEKTTTTSKSTEKATSAATTATQTATPAATTSTQKPVAPAITQAQGKTISGKVLENSPIKNLTELNLEHQRLKDLQSLKHALEAYHRKYKAYPVSHGFDGYKSAWGNSSAQWIKGLTPKFMDKLPRDPELSEQGAKQYLYNSDGKDFKLLAHGVNPVSPAEKKLADPTRPTWAFGYWTPNAEKW